MKPIIHSNFGMTLNYDFDKPIEIWVDNFNDAEIPSNNIKIFVQIEPNEIMGLNEQIKRIAHFFDYVFTYEEDVLNNIPNAILFEYGTKWIEIENYDLEKSKDFNVSTICGHKTITENHRLRQKLWYKQNKIQVPKKFFLSRLGGVENFGDNPILEEKKEPLFDSMFHICIENVSKNYFFTEKLIDCLICKSIPIYVGCPNISNYFNMEGFYIAKDFKEVIDICNSLTEDDYSSKKHIIEENRKLAMNWIDFNYRIYEKIKELL
jgi:hypothetical protein